MSIVISDQVTDFGLTALGACDAIYLCSSMPETYLEATSTLALGSKAQAGFFSYPLPGTQNGWRMVSSLEIADGSFTKTGTVRTWAAVDTSNSRLLASGSLFRSIAVRQGQSFRLPSFQIQVSGILGIVIGVKELIAANIQAGLPILASPQFAYGARELISGSVAAAAPVLGAPSFQQNSILSKLSFITGSPVLGAAALSQVHSISSQGLLVSAPTLASPQTRQLQVLSGSNLSAGVPVFGAPFVNSFLYSTNLALSSPELSAVPMIKLVRKLMASNRQGSAITIGAPQMRVKRILNAAGLAVAAPTLGAPQFLHKPAGAFPTQNGNFTIQWDAVPTQSPENVVTGLSVGPTIPTTVNEYACIARFNTSGFIDVRNGGSYVQSSIAYAAGQSYHFRMVVNMTAHTYSVYVTPPSGSETQIANNFAFNTTQASVATLSLLSKLVTTGDVVLSGMVAPPPTSITYNFVAGGGSILQPDLFMDFRATDWTGTNTVSNDGKWLKAGTWTADGGTEYSPARATIADTDPSGKGDNGIGFLTMRLLTHANPPWGTEVYTTAPANTGLYGHGYYEFRALVPAAFSGSSGVVGFFQIQGEFSSGNFGPNEVDIEFTLDDINQNVNFNLQNTPSAGSPHLEALGFDQSAAYHRYGFLWLADGTVHFTVDGTEVDVISHANYVPNTKGHIVLNMWCGMAGWGGVNPPTQDEFVYVDWVKYYDGATSIPSSSAVRGIQTGPATVGRPIFSQVSSGAPVGFFNEQTGTFTIEWDAAATQANEDCVMGVSYGAAPANGYSMLATSIRFNQAGSFDCVHDADVYSATNTVSYFVGVNFHFRMVIRIGSHTYDAYVTPPGQAEVQIANNYNFRSSQSAQTRLNWLGKVLFIGDANMTNMIGPPPPQNPPVVNATNFSLSTTGTSWVAGKPVGVMTASNAPTSWTITGVSPSGHSTYYAIDNNGQITVTAAGITGLGGTSGTSTITCRATNAFGNGSGNATVNYSFQSQSLKGWQLNASNTGLAGAGVDPNSLPVYTGSNTPPAGTVISLKKITSALYLYNGNITIDRCLIKPTGSDGRLAVLFTYNPDFGATIAASAPTLVTIKDCDCDCSQVTDSHIFMDAFVRGAASVYRCNIWGIGNGIVVESPRSDISLVIENNYIHDTRGGLVNGQQSHNEAGSIRAFNGPSCVFRGNHWYSHTGSDSAAMFIQANGFIKNCSFDGDYFDSGGFWDLALEANAAGYSNMTANNNRFRVGGGTNAVYTDGGPGWAVWTENYTYNASSPPENKGTPV